MDNLQEFDNAETNALLDTGSDQQTFGRDSDYEQTRDHDRDVDREQDRPRSRKRDRQSVRDSIRQSFDDARQDDEHQEELARTRDREQGQVQTQEQDTQVQPKKPDIVAPVSWTKEAKDAWGELPDRIKQEVTKRETDMQKGVEALKKQYSEIDEAIAPYTPIIRQFQKTPAQAVSQLFQWFDALSRDPDRAFPALLQSYRYDPGRLLAAYGLDPNELMQFIQYKQAYAQQQQQLQNGQQIPGQQQQPEEISPAVRQYIDGLQKELSELKNQVGYQFDGLAQTFAAQNQAKTQEMLDRWAADKPYFNQVRVMMGHLLTPDPNTGQAAVPLKDGRVDLDTAYEMAIYALPEIRNQVWQEQQAQQEAARRAKQEADFKAQQEKTAAARRAATSVRTTAPGTQIGRQPAPQKGLSVRDSLKQAISELS